MHKTNFSLYYRFLNMKHVLQNLILNCGEFKKHFLQQTSLKDKMCAKLKDKMSEKC